MKNSIIFIALLIACVVIDSTVIASSFYPISLLPISLIVGIIIFHYFPVEYGMFWFICLPFAYFGFGFFNKSMFIYPLLSIVGFLFVKKSFTRHSMTGLLGLGISLLLIQNFSYALIEFNNFAYFDYLWSLVYELLMLIVALFLLYTMMQKILSTTKIHNIL